MVAQTAANDRYLLGRGYAAATRLNLQHCLWVQCFDDQLLHPTIAIDSPGLKICDVGTGTGIWLLDLSRKVSSGVQLEGLDIDLSQVPPKNWLSPNISFRQYSVFDEPPADLIEKYDVLHVRHLSYVVQENDPAPIIKNLLRMIKPGGFLQWGEHDTMNRTTPLANKDLSTRGLDSLKSQIYAFLPTKNATWLTTLGQVLENHGLISVRQDERWTEPKFLSMHQSVHIMVYEELLEKIKIMPHVTAEDFSKLEKAFEEAVGESSLGAAWDIKKIYAVGKKPT